MAMTPREIKLAAISMIRFGNFEFGELTKGDIKAIIEATDAWLDANMASYKASLPNGIRQKTPNRLLDNFLSIALLRRNGKAEVSEDKEIEIPVGVR